MLHENLVLHENLLRLEPAEPREGRCRHRLPEVAPSELPSADVRPKTTRTAQTQNQVQVPRQRLCDSRDSPFGTCLLVPQTAAGKGQLQTRSIRSNEGRRPFLFTPVSPGSFSRAFVTGHPKAAGSKASATAPGEPCSAHCASQGMLSEGTQLTKNNPWIY